MIRVLAVVAAVVISATACMRDEPEPVRPGDAAPAALPEVPATLGCGGAEQDGSSPRIWAGDGEPDLAIAFESVFSGSTWALARAELEAVRLVLERRGWKAGTWKVALFACTSSPHIRWDAAQCAWNARFYAETEAIVGLLAPFNSGCTAEQLDLLAQAPGGGLASVASANTWTCLTRWIERVCARSDFERQRPSRRGLYFRISGHDGTQAAALADFAAREGWKRAHILDDGEAYGEEVADGFANAAATIGLPIVGRRSWDPNAADYRQLMRTVRRARPDVLLLSGLLDENGARVIRDKVAVLGPNDGAVKLVASDGFLAQATIAEARGAAAGMFASVGRLAADRLPPRGLELLAGLQIEPDVLEEYGSLLAYRAQSAEVLLDAIARSDGTRAGVVAALRETRVRDGLIGSFAFDRHGDATLRWVTVYRAEGRDFVPYRALNPDAALVEAAIRG